MSTTWLRSVVAGALLATAIAPLQPVTAQTDQLPVVNVMPAFLEAWNRGLGRPMPERVALMKELVFEPNRGAFDTPQFDFDDVRIAWYLDDVAPLMPAIQRLSAVLAANLPLYEQRFITAFPDFHPTGKIYFQPSLLNFDGQSRNGVLRFGLDGIVKYDGPDSSLGVLVSHELFHLYHFQIMSAHQPERVALWQQMWEEGLATYVSYRLNPGSTQAQALLSPALAKLRPADIARLACLIQPTLDATGGNDGALFFDAEAAPPGLPPRGAYLIGFLVAQRLGEQHDVRALAALWGDDLHRSVIASVADLCSTK